MELDPKTKLTIKLVLFVVKLLQPTKYSHETDVFINEIKEDIK